MAVRANRYYNDPNLAAGFSNLAAIFAPPSGADTAGYAAAAAKKEEAQRLAQLFAEAGSFDERNIAAGNYAPTSSFYAQDQNTGAKLSMNAADNARALEAARIGEAGALARQFAEPITLGQGETAFLPNQTAAATGLAPMFAGAPKPLSETEVAGGILQSLPPAEQRAALFSDADIAQIVTPEGPRNVFAADAVGQEPFVNKGAEARPTNGMAVINGQRVAVVQKPDGKWTEAQSGAEIPAGIEVYSMPQPTGTNEELGVGKRVQGNIEQQLVDITVAKNTAVRLRDLIQSSPASQGVVGYLRGTAQNVIQTGGEVGAYFGGNVQEVQKRIADGLEDASLAGSFDPNIPAIEMMANLLAFQYAKTTTGERLSNEMLRASRAALGLDSITANQADAVTRLNTAISLIEDQEGILRSVRENGIDAAGPRDDPAATVVNTPEEYEALPSGAIFTAPDGTKRKKP